LRGTAGQSAAPPRAVVCAGTVKTARGGAALCPAV